MKRTILLSVIILVLLLATVALARQRSSSAKESSKEIHKIEFEYLVLAGGRGNLAGSDNNSAMSKIPGGAFRDNYPLEKNLDKLGSEGWELTAVLLNQNEPVYYLKREKERGK